MQSLIEKENFTEKKTYEKNQGYNFLRCIFGNRASLPKDLKSENIHNNKQQLKLETTCLLKHF